MRILVDMDGVLEDLLTPWCNAVNEENGTDVHPEDIVEWDISKAFPTLTRNRIYKPLHDDEFWKQVKPIAGAVVGLKEIIDAGHDVFVVTTSDYRTLKSKMDNVLFKYFPYLTWKNVILTSRKQMIAGDVLIDDGLHNLVGGMYKKVIFDTSYNRNTKDIGGTDVMYRAHNWGEVMAIIDAISNELDDLDDFADSGDTVPISVADLPPSRICKYGIDDSPKCQDCKPWRWNKTYLDCEHHNPRVDSFIAEYHWRECGDEVNVL